MSWALQSTLLSKSNLRQGKEWRDNRLTPPLSYFHLDYNEKMRRRRRRSRAAPEFAALTLTPEVLALKHESKVLGHSSNPVCGFSMMEQFRLCAVWPMDWLFLEPDHCPRILLSCFRARTSGVKLIPGIGHILKFVDFLVVLQLIQRTTRPKISCTTIKNCQT